MANVIKHKRGSGSDPAANNLVIGELAIRTDNGKLFTKMDSGAIAEIAGGGSDIAINTLSSSSATGGGSATFNGSAYRFTLSSPPSVSAAQLLVSVNGVIQKPVAGTGQPSEGFSVSGNDIIFGDAPATGADFFILTFRSLGVSEPADNSVTSAKIVDGAIVNADINASAAISGQKINPAFGGQNISCSGIISTTGSLHVNQTNGSVFFGSGTGYGANAGIGIASTNNFHVTGSSAGDMVIGAKGGERIVLGTNTTTNGVGLSRLIIKSDGTVDIAGNLDVGAGLDVTGQADLNIASNGSLTEPLMIRNGGTGAGTNVGMIFFNGDGISSGAGALAKIKAIDMNNYDGDLVFETALKSGFSTGGTSERLRITSTGRLLVNTTTVSLSKTPMLEVKSSSNNSNIPAALFSSNNGSTAVGISYNTIDATNNLNNSDLIFATNGSERVRVTNGGLDPNTDAVTDLGNSSKRWRDLYVSSGVFIGGTSSSEELDDYEEGTWTPSFYPLSSGIPVTYTTRQGKYTKIGNVVYWHCKIQVSNITGNRNQAFGISGFPHNITNSQAQVSGNFYGETWDGEIPTTLKYFGNVNRGQLYYYSDTMKYFSSSMLDININSSMLMGSGFYYTN